MTKTLTKEPTQTIIVMFKPVRKAARTFSEIAGNCGTVCTNDCMMRGDSSRGSAELSECF
jgi:hypothetical protein